MRHFLKLSFTLCLLIFATSTFAKSWQNVFPLKTTRAEILNLFGNPKTDLVTGEYFFVDDQIVTFLWTRADCSGDGAIVNEKLVEPNSFVYQITVEPHTPLQYIDSYTFDLPKVASSVPGFYSTTYQTNCISNSSGQFSCSSVSLYYGFGYSNSNRGFNSLYFFPTSEEIKTWKEKQKPCPSVGNIKTHLFNRQHSN